MEKISAHEARIQLMAIDMKEVKEQIRDLAAQLNVIRGMGIAFGALMGFLQIVQFATDRSLKKVTAGP